MNIGHLFFDNTQRTLEQKIRNAAESFLKRYGHKPQLCLVNPNIMSGKPALLVDGITVKPWRYILPHHFWIGVEDQRELTAEKVDSPL